MSEAPATQPSLLARLGDPRDGEAWGQFVDLYAPLIHGCLRKHGLQDADAADVTQEVLRAVAAAIGRLSYDPARGSFRGWLFTIVRNKLANWLASPARRQAGTGLSGTIALLHAQPAREELPESLWDEAYERRLLEWASQSAKDCFHEATWQAFWKTAVEGKPPQAAAAELGLSVGAVYIARSRVLAKLRAEIQRLIGEES